MSQLLLSALPVVCPHCDGYNPPRSATCVLCGQALEEAAAPRPTPAPVAARPVTPPPGRPVAVASFPRPGEVPAPAVSPLHPSQVPPGLKPSARTPPPTAAAGLMVEARRAPPPAPGAPGVPAPRAGYGPALPPANTRPPPPVPDSALPGRPSTGNTLPTTADGAPPARSSPPTLPPTAPAAPGPVPTGSNPAARPPPVASRFGLAVIAGTTRGQRYKLPVTGCVVGRQRGAILFPDDVFVSPLHATFLVKDGALYVRDETSASGVYVTFSGTEPLAPRALFSAGQRLFRFTGRVEAPPPVAGRPNLYGSPVPLGQALYGVEEVHMGGRAGRAVVTAAALLTIGQAHCDLAYPHDEGLAGRHCELSPTATGAMLRDLSGGLGTYVRIPPATERLLRPGDRVRLGQHVVQVETLG
ncbi:FHA domain-containing protein [Corallococcus sp. BB11-1]|uniref:FHA domain-containing protein n=1 Tax=Corallococcus sp. BB11-1 TaxID=2996783 RepID=UPI00226FFB6C|nr:FHA domain-containing protein [Corallococcus sp. BB11-1]MCY1032625.1 FHA domain-containing protein [Corallococcus sp. BB11-1]